MSRIALLCGALALVTGSLHAPPAQAAQTLRCESNSGRYQSCAVDTRGGVRLSRQLSSEGCWENDTWGYDSQRIWVTHGCRAEFVVGDAGIESGSGNSNVAAGVAIAALIGAAILASKDKDRDRDYDDSGYHGGGYRPQSTFRCESTSQRQVYCDIPYRGHVEVYRQLSRSACQYGVTWGVDGRRVWVNNGCRADFAVY